MRAFPVGAGDIPAALMPLGGRDGGLTAFSFRDVQLPKNAYVNKVHVDLC